MAPHALNAPHQAPRWSVALVGNPNCGKTALFNLLTGARQKVANYAGVTVERKVGLTRLRQRPHGLGDRPARRLQPDAGHARRADHARGDRGPAPRRGGARRDRRRRRRDQPAHEPAPRARAEAARPAADGRAQHGRRRPRRRAGDRRRAARRPSSAARWSRRSRCKPTATPALLALLEARLGHDAARQRLRRRQPRAGARRARRPTCSRGAPHPRAGRARRGGGAALPAPHRRRRDAPGLGPGAARRRAVPDVPGGVLVGQRADGRDQGGDGRRSASGRRRTWPTARCAACWSTA